MTRNELRLLRRGWRRGRYPGAGNVDYQRVARSLDAIGYCGAVSLEILPAPSADEAARRGIAWMQETWGQ